MSVIQYNLQFEKLCKVMELGEIVGEPVTVSGGFLHRMYTIETTRGKYAVKALNPQIMLRPTAIQNFINSERISNLVGNNIPALPAKIFNGNSIQEIDGQFFLVFDWVKGKSLKVKEIDKVHSVKIAEILADIHMTDFSELTIVKDCTYNPQSIDWNYYLQKGQENNSEWVNLLLENINNLYDWTAQANESAKLLSSNVVISHRDLDPKNVMWIQDNPIIIDWECAGYVNPMQELIETAIYWSEEETGGIDKERFLAFLRAYRNRVGVLQANWRMVLTNGFLGKLGWLEYSLKRSLWIECTDAEEQKMGTAQVTGTINSILCYGSVISELEKWLNDEVL